MDHNYTLILIFIAILGIGIQWMAWRFHIPAIILLTIAGVVVGPVTGVLHPASDLGHLFHPIIELGIAVILFEGGLNLRWHELKEAGSGVKRLCSLGVVLSWALGSTGAYYIGGLSWPVALVFGAIVVVTGPTVIIPLLRQARLKQRVASLLKWEGIINDPIGALLAVLVYGYFSLAESYGSGTQILVGIGWSLLTSLVFGGGIGLFLSHSFRQGKVPEYLKGPITLSAVLLVFGGANLFQAEAGLMACTVLGMVMGNQHLPSMGEIRRFKEYITIFLVSGVFILLTADLDPELLNQLDWRGAALIAFIIFVARPVTILLSLWGSDIEFRERLLVAWIAPRGIVAAAVAGAFAPGLFAYGYAGAEQLVPLIFALIICTVVLHGLSIGWVARRLDLAFSKSNGVMIVGASAWSVGLSQVLQELKVPVVVTDHSWHRLRQARLTGVPVYFGQVLSETAEHAMEFNQIGSALAATDNDAYNALVCTHYGPELGRSNVFQLPAVSEEDPSGFNPSIRGHQLGDGRLYEELNGLFFQGWRFSKTRITEEYTYPQYQVDKQENAMEVLVLRGNEKIVFSSNMNEAYQPVSGDTVVVFQSVRDREIDSDQAEKSAVN